MKGFGVRSYLFEPEKYGVQDQRLVDRLMQLAKKSGQQGWWNSYVVYLEGFTSDFYLEKRSDVRCYSDMYAHLQAQALSPENTLNFLDEAAKAYAGTEFRPDARELPCHL
ncbi:Scr1 family TA system antitoxin-like transcriptional regulator [Streptomyces sp. NPDC002138]|uniref:Scr1 family TA system antitoxin-like transcriptional regulator n=1 Tax=Streptomyces sp. NPDC002138 TaxID=3154410 RepID=UPI00331DE2F9